MLRKLLIAAVAFLLPALAYGGPLDAPPNRTPLVQRVGVLTWKPLGNGLTSSSTHQWALTTGFPCVAAIELEDQASSVQLMFASQLTTDTYTVQQAVVMPSASYGPVTGVVSGVTPYDYTGAASSLMFPVSFNSAGAYKAPYAGLPQAFLGDTSGSGMSAISLVASGAQSGTVTTLTVTSTATNALSGTFKAKPGWYVQDGAGFIPAGTKVSSVGTTTLTIPSTTLGGTIANGTQLFLSPVQLTLSATVPANTNPNGNSYIYSDWLTIPPTARTDGGIVVGETVTGSGLGIPAGTTVTAIGPTSVTLSAALTATTTLTQPVTFSHTTTLTKAGGTFSYRLYTASAAMTHVGETISGTNIPANDIVLNVGTDVALGPYVDLSASPTGAVTSGQTVTFSNVLNTLGTGNGLTTGSTQINFVSTSAKPLLLVRVNVDYSASNTIAFYNYGANQILGEQALGLPLFQFFKGRNAFDSVNVIGNTGNTNSTAYGACPLYAVNYVPMHRGIQVNEVGDSLIGGKTTISDSANFVRLAAAKISTPQLPVSVANFGMSGLNFNDFGYTAAPHIQNVPPSIIFAEGYSANTSSSGTDTPQSFAGKLNALLAQAGPLVFPVIATHPPQQAQLPAQFVVSAATTSSTSVPISTTVPITISGVPLTDSMSLLPANTTGSFVKAVNGNTLTLSQAASLAANDIIYANYAAVSSTTTSSTTIPVASGGLMPSAAGACSLSYSGSPAGLTGTFAQGGTSITASQAVSITSGTIITITNCTDSNFAASQLSVGMDRALYGTNSAVGFFDYYAAAVDPANDGYYLPGCSVDSGHPSDTCSATVANKLVPSLRKWIGNTNY